LPAGAAWTPRWLAGERFRQEDGDQRERQQRQQPAHEEGERQVDHLAGGRVGGGLQQRGEAGGQRRVGVGQQPAQERPEDHAQAHGCAHHADAPRPVLGGGGVGHVSHCGGQRCGREHAGQRPRQNEPEQRLRDALQEECPGKAGQADQQHRLAPDAVGEASPERRKEKLHEGIERDHQPQRRARGVEVGDVEGHQRDGDAKAEHDDDEGGKEHGKRPAVRPGRGGWRCGGNRHEKPGSWTGRQATRRR
jgi:hypothetical protein